MKKQKPPLCPKCDSERVGWSETSEEEMLECRLCDPWYLFEPPEHMKGKGPSEAVKQAKRRELKIESSPPPSRERGDEFYWFINDALVEALAFSGGYLPKPYIEWKHQHPTDSIKEWVEEEVDKFLNRARMAKDWKAYLHSTEPDKVLESITSLQHCYTEILKDERFPPALNNLRERSADCLSRGLKKALHSERERYLRQRSKEHTESVAKVEECEWVSQKTAAGFLAPHLRTGTCSPTYIRQLARERSIIRHERTSKIKSSSLTDYRNSLI